jgi:hypothetical protein
MKSRQIGSGNAQSPAGAARRTFLRTAVVGGVSIALAETTANAAGAQHAGVRAAGDDPLLDVLQRYGSELGRVTRIR